MAELIVVAFDQPDTADHALRELTAMGKEKLIELEDACVVVRPPQGEVQLKQMLPLTKVGALSGASSGALWGALVGLLFLNPLAGMVVGAGVGAGTGALAGRLSDYGIDDDFIAAWAAPSSRTARPCSCWCARRRPTRCWSGCAPGASAARCSRPRSATSARRP